MDPREIAQFIDHAVLAPDARAAHVEQACEDALRLRFRGVVVPSGAVTHAKRLLMNTGIKVIAVVAFPHGAAAPDVKAWEATRAAAMGADEIDYVISIGAALDADYKFVHDEGIAILRATRGKLVKAIIETGYLTDEIKFHVANTLADAGVHYVKTCTGFGPGRASVEDVQLLARAVHGRALVKASGGISEARHCLHLLHAGAAILGTSAGVEICSGQPG